MARVVAVTMFSVEIPELTVMWPHGGPMSPDQRSHWIAGHEARHTVLAIEYGCPVRAVLLKQIATGNRVSNARTAWRAGQSTLLERASVISGGSVYDRSVASSLAVPPGEALAVEAVDKKELGDELDRQMGRTMSEEAVQSLWDQGGAKAMKDLNQPHVRQAAQILEDLFYRHLIGGTSMVPSAEIYAAVAQLFPAERLNLTDPNEDLSDLA